MIKDKPKINTRQSEGVGTYLDTLEVTSEIFKSQSHESLYQSAIRKGNTGQKVKALYDASKNPIYWKAWHCQSLILQDGNKGTGSLCRKRWCQNCNRIKTAEMINGYFEPLKALKAFGDWYLVTLTAPTVKERQLQSEITKRYKAFVRIKDRLRKQGLKLVGIRSLEITYSESKDWFHPHFHFLCLGEIESKELRKEWLKEFPDASINGNHIVKVGLDDAKDLKEVFKYTVKDEVKEYDNYSAIDKIYQSLMGRRCFQAFGKLAKVKPPKERKTEVQNLDFVPPTLEIWQYDQALKDYTNYRGVKLIGTSDIEIQLQDLKETHESQKRPQNR
jgi:hypothetical protein